MAAKLFTSSPSPRKPVKFKSRIPGLIRKHFFNKDKNKGLDIMWLSRVLNMEDKLEIIFESYKSLGEKYKYCAGNIWANKNLELKKTDE